MSTKKHTFTFIFWNFAYISNSKTGTEFREVLQSEQGFHKKTVWKALAYGIATVKQLLPKRSEMYSTCHTISLVDIALYIEW